MREPDYGSANRENGGGVSILMAGMTVFCSAVEHTGNRKKRGAVSRQRQRSGCVHGLGSCSCRLGLSLRSRVTGAWGATVSMDASSAGTDEKDDDMLARGPTLPQGRRRIHDDSEV